MKEYTREQIITGWNTMLAKMDKYFSNALRQSLDEDVIEYRRFVVSPSKPWVFNILNKVLVNRFSYDGVFNTPQFPDFKPCKNAIFAYIDEETNTRYKISTRYYVNGNTLIEIEFKKL